jgi:hypothetical protein
MSPRRSVTAPPLDALATLAAIAEVRFVDEFGADDPDTTAAALIRVRADDDGVELGIRPLDDGDHPVEALVGFHVPPDWCAVGVAATGVAHHLDRPGERTGVVTVHLVGADGCWASRWSPRVDDRLGTAGSSAAGTAVARDRPIGRVDDSCRRALGLATDPPPATTHPLWILRWLDAVVDEAGRRSCRRGRAPLDWGEVARLHPASSALGRADVAGGRADRDPPTPGELAADARRLAAWRTWPVLRRSCATGTLPALEVGPGAARWLDDGAFARWSLGAYPDALELCAAVEALLRPSVVEAIEAVMAATVHDEGAR